MENGENVPSTETVTLQIEGMECGCEGTLVEQKMKSLAGVRSYDLNRYCQVNGSKDIIVPKCREACNPSMYASRLLPIGKSSAAEESVVNCFEMVATNSEEVLNETMHC